MARFFKYSYLEAKMRLLEDAGALLTTKISIAFSQLKDHDGLVRGHVPAAYGVFLYHAKRIRLMGI